jgi:hypothetical protein
MKRKLRKNLKGISTIIATIIIVAIAIVMAIAVAYWALGIGGSFTRFEKLQYTYGYVTAGSSSWLINLQVQNTGTATATIGGVYLNGIPYNQYAGANMTLTGATITAGAVANVTVGLNATAGAPWVSGMSVEVAIQTVAGNSYPKTLQLP